MAKGWGQIDSVDTKQRRIVMDEKAADETQAWVKRLGAEILAWAELSPNFTIEALEEDISPGQECDLCGYHDGECSVDVWYITPEGERKVKSKPVRMDSLINHLLALS